MKKTVISLILIIMLGAFYAPLSAAAADDLPDTETVDSVIHDYLQTDKGRYEFLNAIERFNYRKPHIYNGIEGDIEVSQPFGIPLYNIPTNSFFDMEQERYSLCYCGDRAAGIMRFIPEGDEFIMIYYMLPDDFSCGGCSLCFYEGLYSSKGETMFGSSGFSRTILSVDSDGTDAVYINAAFRQLRNLPQLYDLMNSGYFQTKRSYLKKFNYLDGKLPVMCTINSEGYSKMLPDNFSCTIVNSWNGRALTYSEGKYSSEEVSFDDPDSQIFIIHRNKSGYYISPKNAPNKWICIDSDPKIKLTFAFHGELVCRLCGADGSVLKIKNGKAVCGSYDIMDASCDWILTEAK